MKLTVLIGPSGCGKTTYSKKLVSENDRTFRVNRDDIRTLLGLDLNTYSNRKDFKKIEENINDIQHELILNQLNAGNNVILDTTFFGPDHKYNVYKKSIDNIINRYNHRCDIEFIFIEQPYEVALENLRKREGLEYNVDYLKQHFDIFGKIKEYFIVNNIPLFIPKIDVRYHNDVTLTPAIICDLDGTLSLFDREVKNPYHRDFENDIINEPIREYLHFQMKYGTQIVFFSGRRENYEKQTREFLTKCGFSPDDYLLFMRMDGDNRSDDLIKFQLFDDFIRDKYYVKVIFDDRLQVLENVWLKLGIPVFNVNQGNIRF